VNLTEVLLSIIISLAVLAGGFFLYTSVADRNGVSTVMQSLPILRANIEDVYQNDYADIGTDSVSGGNLYSLGLFPQGLTVGEGMKTRWGDVTLAVGDEDSQYTITLDSLSPEACMQLGRYQYKSWAKVEVGAATVWTRGQTTPFSTADLVEACNAGSVTIKYTAP